jgi:hypothetical protein
MNKINGLGFYLRRWAAANAATVAAGCCISASLRREN